ncbi:hypothetical protein G7070_00340 [Propioniciclava coleopterorum]|uniref:Uncharacterized protein n=1 Tax=Propioniciclava coleopterorum TaxID=2714937 RepID=A0A6G7Y2E9_9ACTN|nr:hypothetical protein [Propioniciclava coleopterorum]QIK71010.1 hypothetical protein G7070_00340 [Propioniciclava coleopterorum]
MPVVRMRTPAIWIMVATRTVQSSVSNAESNQVLLIHAQHTANSTKKKAADPSTMWPAASECANSDPATPNATTRVRS